MKCPKCGKENPDIRLFCMSCGELMPEEELAEAQNMVSEQETPETEATPEIEIPDPKISEESVEPEASEEISDEDTEFFRTRQRARRVIEEAWPEDNIPKSVEKPSIFDGIYEKTAVDDENPFSRNANSAEFRQRPVLERTKAAELGNPNTIIPKRDDRMDPDDFFAVKGQVLPEYDVRDEKPRKSAGKKKARYEEEPKLSFAAKHMRGIVTLLLLALTGIIVFIWSNTDNAQLMLASIDMAWKPEAYAQLADEAYAVKDLSAAGYYYTQAFERDGDNYNYAVMAANSYIEGGYTSKALDAVRDCIALKPADGSLYLMLLNLQPDIEGISDADVELLQQGYKLTGDDRLNIK